MEPTTWPQAINLGALLALAVVVISSCTEEPAPSVEVPSPTAAPLGSTPTAETTTVSAPTKSPTPVDRLPCEEGMIVPKGSGCWALRLDHVGHGGHVVIDDYDVLLFEVDQLGRGSARDGDSLHGPQFESIRIEFTITTGKSSTTVYFVRWTVLRADPNTDGSWTIKELWLRSEGHGHFFVTPTPTVPQYGGTLRVASGSSVDSLDPVYSETYATAAISSHIFETPLGWNSRIEVKPRMAESWELSPDRLTYTFHLRDGLRFHSGDGVDAGDLVASLERWLDGDGAHAVLLREFVDRDNPFSVVDGDTFTVNLDEPYGQVPSAFARPHGAPFILPEEIAGSRATSESMEIDELVGSGAYRFSEWRQGDRITLERYLEGFEYYAPADGPPDLYVGGTIGYLDSIIWLEIPDEETRIAGLETGEWDVVEMASFGYFERLSENPDITVPLYTPGHRSWYQLIPSHPPFDDLKIRRAALFATNVVEVMHSLGSEELWDLCPAIYYCRTTLETDVGGNEWYAQFDLDRARRLLEESTYAGETIVVLNPTDYSTGTPSNDVIRRQFEEVGFNVDMPELDWAAVVARLSEPETFELSVGWQSHWCCGDPISDSSGAGVSRLWPRVPYVTELRLDWARKTDPVEKAAILDGYQIALYENVYNVYLGVFYPLFPHTSDLKDFDVKAIPFYSNSFLDR